MDCYAGRGGLPIQPDPFSNQLPLADCRAACDSRPACEGIVTGTSGQCYLRTKLDLSRCVRDPKWTLHLAPRFSGPTTGPTTTTRRPSGGFGCAGGVQSYPRSLPNSHYYRQLCTTSKGLRIVSAGRASRRALERTAFLLSQVGTKLNEDQINWNEMIGDRLCRPPGDCLYDCSWLPSCCYGKVLKDHLYAKIKSNVTILMLIM